MHGLIAPTINLLILVSALVYYLRQPLADFVHNRHTLLRDEIQRVRTMLLDAQTRYEEFSAKLKAIDAETNELRNRARQDAKEAQSRIISEAQNLSKTVVSDAKASADSLFSELRGKLHHELGLRVIDRAEEILRERLTGDDRARIRQEFSRQVGTVQ